MLFVFALSAFVQISFWMLIWIGLNRARRNSRMQSPAPNEQPAISVVVAIRNEAKRLGGLFDSLLHQRFTDFEIVLVDDGSDDGSRIVIEEAASRDPRITVVENTDTTRGKKGAITTGVGAARHELLAFTDADCRPKPGWLAAVAAAHGPDPDVVVGYGPLAHQPGPLNALIRFETLTTAMMTAASIGLGHPYMAVGRNLSYSKSVVSKLPSRRSGSHLLSGDDDLFIQDAARAGIPICYLFDPESFVVSPSPESLTSWVRQKRRHISASRAYHPLTKIVLGAFHAAAVMTWIAPLVIGWPGLILIGIKLAVQWPITVAGATTFREPDFRIPVPLLDLGLLIVLMISGPWGVLFPPKKW
jgi:cellulose synthase/poly-beta-1,6-N-acetylglucosamine synthase-like glycosyltransferase